MSEDGAGSEQVSDYAERYRKLVEHIEDAIVEFEFVDGDPVVRGVNDAFEETFGYQRTDLRGTSLNEWIVPARERTAATNIDTQTAAGEVTTQRVTRQTADGLKEFLHRSVPYPESDKAIDGIAIYTDLTEITQQRTQLQVVSRVLRHNLRNQVNVITGNTTQLLAAFEEQTVERTDAAASIEAAARSLESLSDDAWRIKQILKRTYTDECVDSIWLIQRTVEQARRQYASAEIQTDVPQSLVVRVDERLRFAFESLIENAIEHNPAARPQVRVRVTDAGPDGWVTICVDDDGPSIPTDEQEVIGDTAAITPTQHGSGLGLWVVKWTVEAYGGELLIRESDLGGNSVRLRLLRGSED